jgi:predicted branched-subunit amino acid permease
MDWTARTFWGGARDAAIGPAWLVGVSLASVGALAHDLGLPAWLAALSTPLVWAGPGQLIYFASLSAHVGALAILTATTLAAVRFVPMVVSLLPRVRAPGTGLFTQIVASHFIAVTVWVETMRRAPAIPVERRMTYMFGFACACIAVSTLTTLAGYLLADWAPGPVGAALLFVSPIYFTVSLARGAREAMDWAALALGLSLAPVMQAWVGGGLDLLATGAVAGGTAYLLRKWRQGRGLAP